MSLPANEDDIFCLLHRIEPEKNVARFYLVKTGPSLLDAWSVIRFWGRIGGHQRHFVTACGSAQEANTLARPLVQRRLRRGYRIVRGNLPTDQDGPLVQPESHNVPQSLHLLKITGSQTEG